jgi:hypothetical protein
MDEGDRAYRSLAVYLAAACIVSFGGIFAAKAYEATGLMLFFIACFPFVVGIGLIAFNRHERAFIADRMAEGKTKAEARSEYRTRHPVGD